MKTTLLKISEPFVKVQHLEDIVNYKIKGKTILLNVSKKPTLIEGKLLKPWHSSIFANMAVPRAQSLISIAVKPDFLSRKAFKYAATIRKKWTYVYDLFHLARHKGLDFYRSEKDKINGVEFNLWFAGRGTDCGLHKHEVGFREVHTQVFGIGRMQKFHKNDFSSIYQDVFMSPGYTHEPFYDAAGRYPWHQYYADTDCIWIAAEGVPKQLDS